MATKPAAATESDQSVNMQQHGFSGKTCEIKIFKGNAIEDPQPFFSINHYTAKLQRDVWVRVPVELADHIESLQYQEIEPDPEFPDDRSKDVWAPRSRYQFQRRD